MMLSLCALSVQPSMMRGLSLALLVGAAHAQQGVVTVRGSGTTNPKKIHWELMETMEAMAGERDLLPDSCVRRALLRRLLRRPPRRPLAAAAAAAAAATLG